MKNIFLIAIFILSFTIVHAQNDEPKSRKERKAEKELRKAEQVKKLLNEKNFVFEATHALPMAGGSRYLSYDYDVKVKNDSVSSYLPFFGRAYRVEFGTTSLPFEFHEPLNNYELEQDGDAYIVNLEMNKGIDHLNYTFHVAENGNATLHVTSTNRQSISYYGTIQEEEMDE